MSILKSKPSNRAKTPIDHDMEDIQRRTDKAMESISKRLTEIKKSLISLSNEQDRLENYLEKLRESKTYIK